MAVEEPGAGVVRLEPDRDVVAGRARGRVLGPARAHRVAPDRVLIVVLGAARAAHDGEHVLSRAEARAGGRSASRRTWTWSARAARGEEGEEMTKHGTMLPKMTIYDYTATSIE